MLRDGTGMLREVLRVKARAIIGKLHVKRLHVTWAFLSYLALTIALTQPLLWNMTQAIASDAGDPILTAWILWWNTAAVPLTDRWWNAGIFYPVKDAFTFSETMLGLVPLSAPMQWLTGNPALAFNVAFLLSFPLSAIAAYLLCFEISGRRDASWIAGIAYGFCPYRIDHLSHLHLLSAYWLPILVARASSLPGRFANPMAGAVRRDVHPAGPASTPTSCSTSPSSLRFGRFGMSSRSGSGAHSPESPRPAWLR